MMIHRDFSRTFQPPNLGGFSRQHCKKAIIRYHPGFSSHSKLVPEIPACSEAGIGTETKLCMKLKPVDRGRLAQQKKIGIRTPNQASESGCLYFVHGHPMN